jgi:mono/diheme cytochrome c family protein
MVLIMSAQFHFLARFRWVLKSAFGAVLVLGLSGCLHSEPTYIYMPDMVYQPALKAQSVGSMRPPVKGTIPRDFVPYPYSNIGGAAPIPGSPEAKAAAAHPRAAATDANYPGKELKNPLRPTLTVLKRGQVVFNTYCIVCHGPAGMGDGSVVPRFPRPPSLQSDKVRNWPDGNIYHVITMGQNMMPSYASQIAPGDRWAVIHYVRALQRSQHPSPDDVKEAEKE